MAAEITFNQPTGAGAGVAGKARNDIWLSQVVNMVSSGTGTTYLWELLDAPPGSAATIGNPTLSTANVTPDVMGTYRISLKVDSGGGDNTIIKVIRARYDSSGVLTLRGWALPAVDEEIEEADYGTNTRHWDEVWQSILPDIRKNLTRVLVFQPNGTAGGNIYTDWGDLMVAMGDTTGPKIVEFDDTYGVCTIPAGTYDLNYNTILRSNKPTVDLVFQDNAIFQNAFVLEGFLNVYSQSTAAVFTWTGPKYLVLCDSVGLYGSGYAGPPASPLITTPSTNIILRNLSGLYAAVADEPILEDSSGSSQVFMYDSSTVATSDGSPGGSYALSTSSGAGSILVRIYDQGVHYYNQIYAGLTKELHCIRRHVVSLTNGVVSNSSTTPAACGACSVSFSSLPVQDNLTCKFRVIIETTSGTVGSEAYIDLFDVFGVLNSGSPGTPQVITGSQVDTGTGLPPTGAPTPNALLPSAYEVDLTATIIGGTWANDIAIFEGRLWIGTASGGNAATCKSAELIFEW